MKSKRPWGYFEVLTKGEGYQVKRLTIFPSHRISLQSHKHRNEHWFFASGMGQVEYGPKDYKRNIGDVEFEYNLADGESFDIKKGYLHRVRNTGRKNLVIIEVQTGKKIEEDDIVRYQDDYNR